MRSVTTNLSRVAVDVAMARPHPSSSCRPCRRRAAGSPVRVALFSNTSWTRRSTRCSTPPGRPRPHYRALVEELLAASPEELRQRQLEADRAFLTQGITFTVYGDEQGTERIFPVRSAAADRHGARVGDARARPDAAADRHQPVPARTSTTRAASSPRASCRAISSTAAATTAARCAACASTATSTSRSPAPI